MGQCQKKKAAAILQMAAPIELNKRDQEQRKSLVAMQTAEQIQEKTVLIDQTKSHLHLGKIVNVKHAEKLL